MKSIAVFAFIIGSLSLPEQTLGRSTPKFPLARNLNTMIVGGKPASQGQFPYQLEILSRESHSCGASLVEVEGAQVAITAAHCVYVGEEPNIVLVAGELDRNVTSGLEQRRQVSKIVRHTGYGNSDGNWNDIAVLFFNGSFSLNENVQLVPLPQQGQNTTGNITVSGWGRLSYGGASPNMLQYVEIPVVSNEACKEAWDNYPYPWFNPEVIASQICAGESTGTISPCHGDSGGPARSEDGYLAGIVSWGMECGHPDYPGVFTRASHFIDWIHETVSLYKAKNIKYAH